MRSALQCLARLSGIQQGAQYCLVLPGCPRWARLQAAPLAGPLSLGRCRRRRLVRHLRSDPLPAFACVDERLLLNACRCKAKPLTLLPQKGASCQRTTCLCGVLDAHMAMCTNVYACSTCSAARACVPLTRRHAALPAEVQVACWWRPCRQRAHMQRSAVSPPARPAALRLIHPVAAIHHCALIAARGHHRPHLLPPEVWAGPGVALLNQDPVAGLRRMWLSAAQQQI